MPSDVNIYTIGNFATIQSEYADGHISSYIIEKCPARYKMNVVPANIA